MLRHDLTAGGKTDDRIDTSPNLVADSPSGTGDAVRLDGAQRIRVGHIDIEDWADLTISAWVKTSSTTAGMRVVSKDRIGEPGALMLWHDLKGAWSMQVADRQPLTLRRYVCSQETFYEPWVINGVRLWISAS